MLDGSTIAAILTGVLALIGALATAWMSGWNEQRLQARRNRKALARYSVPLMIAAYDLSNWFYDILGEENYSPQRCKAYGDGWRSQFTSYLLGQYFSGVYIIREMTQFFADMKTERANMLNKLLWKIQDEFVSMYYQERESLEMRWFEGDMLAVQEQLTTTCDLDGDGIAGEMRTIGWVEFQQMYAKSLELKPDESWGLKENFGRYERDFQRIIYRRFKRLYSRTEWEVQGNPQSFERLKKKFNKEGIEVLMKEEEDIKTEQERNPNIGIVVPDHRVRRLQHLLSDLVELLDLFQVSTMEFRRPVRRCSMLTENNVVADGNLLNLEVRVRIPCDCHSQHCNPRNEDFLHRQLTIGKGQKGHSSKGNLFHPARQTSFRPVDINLMRKTTEKESSSPC